MASSEGVNSSFTTFACVGSCIQCSGEECPHHRLLLAASTGNLELLKELAAELDRGEGLAKTVSDVDDCLGRSALHFAAGEAKTNVCKYLVQDLKLDVNVKDGEGETPLNHAIMGKHHQTAVFLLENGANPNLANDKGFSALHYAAEIGSETLTCQLISKGAEVEAKSDSGTPLHCAAAKGRKEIVKILLDKKANPNSVCHPVRTPLMLSIIAGSFECTNMLLEAGANPDLGSHEDTPLGIATSRGEIEVIKCLLMAGANPNVTNIYGLTPLEIAAVNCRHHEVMILFPFTSQIPSFPDWSFAGIIKHVHSEEHGQQRAQKIKERLPLLKSKGREAFEKKYFIDAIYWYTQAINVDPTDETLLSNRSLCWARMNDGPRALSDAEACVLLRPDWPKAHYRKGVAWRLLKNFPSAAEAFRDALMLDPENEELKTAFRDAGVCSFFGEEFAGHTHLA